MIKIFIGYDRKETIAYHVLAHSILSRATLPVSITPIDRFKAANYYRPKGEFDSTDFSNARFMVPHMCDYYGWAIFMDCDMLVLDDIRLLWEQRDPKYAVMVKKHDYVPRETTKFLGAVQTAYERKNWSSLMMFNTERCQALNPPTVNTKHGLWMHRFEWCADEEIGEIEGDWNYLVGVQDAPAEPPSALHYTLGGPWFKEYRDCAYSDAWYDELADMVAGDNPDGHLKIET